MTALPARYSWLANEPGPKMLHEALKLYGTREFVGPTHNPVILGWAKEIGQPGYTSDETAWCGLFMGIAAHRAGWEAKPKTNALWARNWAHWGTPADIPMLGDVLVFPRGAGGHVGLYIGEDSRNFFVLGGNQGNEVSIIAKPKVPLIAARRAPWRISQPANVRRVTLNGAGIPTGQSEA
ncbi:TIGR02594 family protein [Phreatobacter sp. HK31-P]